MKKVHFDVNGLKTGWSFKMGEKSASFEISRDRETRHSKKRHYRVLEGDHSIFDEF